MGVKILFLMFLMVTGLLVTPLLLSVTSTFDEGCVYAMGKGGPGKGGGPGNSGGGPGKGGEPGNSGGPGSGRRDLSAVPEPTSLLLMGAGLVGYALFRKRRKNRGR